MDHQNTIPSQLSPDTIPSVLSPEPSSLRERRAASRSGSWLGWLAAGLVLLALFVVLS